MGCLADKDRDDMVLPARRIDRGIELILCPKQPGNLWISKYACALRYKKAVEMGDKIPDDEFGICLKVGLDICRHCRHGRQFAEHLLKIDRTDKPKAPKPNLSLDLYTQARGPSGFRKGKGAKEDCLAMGQN